MGPIHLYTGGLYLEEGEHIGPDCLGEHDDPVALARWYPFDTVPEMCGECGAEVQIPAFGASRCPECGAGILPCSMCGEVMEDGYVHMRCWERCPYSVHREVQ